MIIANTSHSKNKGIKGIQRAMDIKIFLGIPRAMVQQPSKLQYYQRYQFSKSFGTYYSRKYSKNNKRQSFKSEKNYDTGIEIAGKLQILKQK